METLDILRQRQLQGYATGDDDGRKLYMAVDGGGMGGVISLGALHQLNEEGLLDHVDGFAGSSAGSINSAYAMTNNTVAGRDIYVNYLPDNKFIRYTRPVTVSIADSDWPVSHLPLPTVEMWYLKNAMHEIAPLATKQVVEDPRELIVGLSNLDDGEALAISSHDLRDNPNDLIEALLNGATLPLGLVPKYYSSRFGRCADAAIFWPTPDNIARTRHPSHVLSIASALRPTRTGGLVQRAADKVLEGWLKNYSEASAETSRQAAQTRDLLIEKFVESDRVTVDESIVERIYPEGVRLPSRQTMNKRLLRAGFEAGRRGVISVMQRPPRIRY
jgi:predicted acylesterase/phospholipase RssA